MIGLRYIKDPSQIPKIDIFCKHELINGTLIHGKNTTSFVGTNSNNYICPFCNIEVAQLAECSMPSVKSAICNDEGWTQSEKKTDYDDNEFKEYEKIRTSQEVPIPISNLGNKNTFLVRYATVFSHQQAMKLLADDNKRIQQEEQETALIKKQKEKEAASKAAVSPLVSLEDSMLIARKKRQQDREKEAKKARTNKRKREQGEGKKTKRKKKTKKRKLKSKRKPKTKRPNKKR